MQSYYMVYGLYQDNQTALHLAKHDEVVRDLLAAKATVNTQTKVCFDKHISHNNVMLFTLFSSHVQSGHAPLMSACFSGYQKCVKLLINAGAIVDALNKVSV